MSSSNTILPPSSLCLVTGANGFIGSHVIDQLLQKGYAVRGTVRNIEKNAWLQKLFDDKYSKGKLELVQVEDFTREGALDEAVKGVAAFAHIASDLSFNGDPNQIVTPTIASVKNALASALKESGLKSFVLTSSSTAATKPYPNKEFHIDASTWNEADIEAAWAPPPYERSRAWAVYAASKAQGERAAWEFVKEHKPHFTVNTILPNANFGKILDPEQQHGSTAGWIRMAYTGKFEPVKDLPPQYYVDVQDTARLHVVALTDTAIANERIMAFAQTWSWNEIFDIVERIRPDLKDRAPPRSASNDKDLSTVDTALALRLLKERFGQDGWTKLETSLKANLESVQ